MQVVPVKRLDDLQTALQLVARRGTVAISEDEAFRAGRTIGARHKLAALIGYGNRHGIDMLVILPLARTAVRGQLVNSKLIRARLVKGELREVKLVVPPVLEVLLRLLLLGVAIALAHRRAGDELAVDGSPGNIVSRSHGKGEFTLSGGADDHLGHRRGVGCRIGDRIGVLEFDRRNTGRCRVRRVDPLALELVLAINLLAYRRRDPERAVAVVRHDSPNRMDRVVVRKARRLVVKLAHRIGERLASIILSEGQPTLGYQAHGLGGVGLDICGLKDLAVRGNADLAGRGLIGRLDDIAERALGRAEHRRTLGVHQRLLDLQAASGAIVEACRITVHKRYGRRCGTSLACIVLLHVGIRFLLELGNLFVRQRARIAGIAQQLRHTRTLEHGRHGVELGGIVLACKNLNEHDGVAGVAGVIGVASGDRLVLVDAIGKRMAQILLCERASKELLFPACAHHGTGHAGPRRLIGQVGLGAIDRRLDAVVPKTRHGKGKLARRGGAALKGLAHRHAAKGARRMVCVGKGGLVGYGLVCIGGIGVGIGHARHVQLARVIALLVQIGHHDSRTRGVLVHGHARLVILRGVLSDIEAKGARAVERHGRGGLGAKSKRCYASRLGRAGSSLAGVNGNSPVRYRLCGGLVQSGHAGIVRSGGKVKGIAIALIPVATAHGFLALQGHARGLHAIYIGKGRHGVRVQLLYRAVCRGLVVLDRGFDAGTLFGVAHHSVIDRPVIGHARDTAGILSELVHVGASRVRLGGIGDRRPRHRTVGVVAHGRNVALGALGHGGFDARVDRIGAERCVGIRIAAHAFERKAKGILGKREGPGLVGQVLLSMDDDVLLMLVVAIGEGCYLNGNLLLSLGARVVTLLHHPHALNDQSTGMVVLHHNRRSIGGGGVAYAICPGIGTGDNLLDGIGIRARPGIGNVAKCCRLGFHGELDRRHFAPGALGHGDAVLGCKLRGKGIAIGPFAALELLLDAQAILGRKRYRAGAVVVGELKLVALGNLSTLELADLTRDSTAGARLLHAAGLAAHESKASRKHRLIGRAGHGVDDTRQHIAARRLTLGSELAHAILVALLKVVHANSLAGLDGMGFTVLKYEGLTCGLAVRIEHMRLVALLGLRQGELKCKGQVFALRILGRRGEAIVCRHGLGHLQTRHATVGILHGRCRGKEMVELERTQVSTSLGDIVYICWIVFLVKGHAVDARIGKDRRQLAVALATILDIAQDGLGALCCLVIAHVHQVIFERRRHTVGGALLAPRQASAGINGRALQLALNVRKRVIDGTGRAKLRQRGNQRAWAAHTAHAVVLLAGIHVHTRIVHDHLGDGGIYLVAIRAHRFAQVVRTLDKGLLLCRIEREACGALNVIRIGHAVCLHGVIRRGAGLDGIRAGAIAGNVLGLVQIKRRAVHRLAQVVDLLHKQTVLNVRKVDHG